MDNETAIKSLIELNGKLIRKQGNRHEIFAELRDQIEIDSVNLAISALRNQSEAEKRMGKVKEYCNHLKPSPFRDMDSTVRNRTTQIIKQDIMRISEGEQL